MFDGMSPSHVYSNSCARVCSVNGSSSPGVFGYDNVNNSRTIRPVISLKPDVVVLKGKGTNENPYEVEI